MRRILIMMITFLPFYLVAQDFDSVFNKANGKFFEKNYKEASLEYQKMIESGMGDSIQRSWIYGYIGVCFQELKQIEKAKRNYILALKLGSPNASFYSKLLKVYKSEKDIKGQEFVLLLRKENVLGEYKKAVKSLAYLYVNSEQFEKLLVVCDELIGWYPSNYKYRYFKAVSHQKTNKIEKAIKEYRKAIELKLDDANSNMNLGMILFFAANNLYDLAVKNYEAIAKPTDDDYQKCKRKLNNARAAMRKAELFLLRAYKGKPNENVKKALFNLYNKCNQRSRAKQYK